MRSNICSTSTFVTCMAFVGLILGGLPAIIFSMKSKMTSGGIGVFGILAFVIAFVISGGMPLLKESKDALTVIAVTPVNMVILFILGVVASATMVIPGVSGSMMLMIFGYYYAIINTIKTFLDNLRAFDLMGMKDGILLLAPFGIGVILGIFLIAKLITFLFEKYGGSDILCDPGTCDLIPDRDFYQHGSRIEAWFPVHLGRSYSGSFSWARVRL